MMGLKSSVRLYGYALLVLLVCLGVYVGAFMLAVRSHGNFNLERTLHALQEQKPPLEHSTQAPPKQTPPSPPETKEIPNTQATPPAQIAPQTAQEDPTPQTPKPLEAPKQTQDSPPPQIFTVSFNVVNVRAHPNTQSRIVEKIFKGQEVQVLEIKEGWARIKKGWVFLHLLKKSSE
ncbi:SH3 domain-containing protein [Helicobacter mehlei]|nr:SH3 domain-containing protein [Helicobacter mehlei]